MTIKKSHTWKMTINHKVHLIINVDSRKKKRSEKRDRKKRRRRRQEEVDEELWEDDLELLAENERQRFTKLKKSRLLVI